VIERLGQQVDSSSTSTPRTQQAGELVMLLLRPRHPGQPVEEQLVVVARVESAQLGAGTVQDGHP